MIKEIWNKTKRSETCRPNKVSIKVPEIILMINLQNTWAGFISHELEFRNYGFRGPGKIVAPEENLLVPEGETNKKWSI